VTPVLAVSNLRKAFGGVHAVDDVSFALASGELLALIGPNGAGKSTCFNMLNGQLGPDSGAIQLDGADITGLTPRQIWRRGVGRTFQITATFGSMSVIENVQMVLLSHHRQLNRLWRPAAGRHADAARALLARVGMAAQADRPCGILAYGDLKRVELAGREAAKILLALARHHGAEQFLLAREIGVERRFRRAGLAGDRVHADRAEPAHEKRPPCRRKDALGLAGRRRVQGSYVGVGLAHGLDSMVPRLHLPATPELNRSV